MPGTAIFNCKDQGQAYYYQNELGKGISAGDELPSPGMFWD